MCRAKSAGEKGDRSVFVTPDLSLFVQQKGVIRAAERREVGIAHSLVRWHRTAYIGLLLGSGITWACNRSGSVGVAEMRRGSGYLLGFASLKSEQNRADNPTTPIFGAAPAAG